MSVGKIAIGPTESRYQVPRAGYCLNETTKVIKQRISLCMYFKRTMRRIGVALCGGG